MTHHVTLDGYIEKEAHKNIKKSRDKYVVYVHELSNVALESVTQRKI